MKLIMNTSLPTSVYPNVITNPSAWKSEDLSPSQSWNVSLTEEQVDDLTEELAAEFGL